MSSQLLLIHEVLKSALGQNLSAVVAFGSTTRPEDAAPLSELNLLIIVKEKIPAAVRVRIAEMLGSNVSTIVLDLESFRQMVREGEYLAHEALGGGRILYSDEEFEKILEEKPPISRKTLEYLRRHALACIALSIENLAASRYMWSINYAYKAIRSVARLYAARRGALPFSDEEIVEALKPENKAAPVFVKMKEVRKAGVKTGDLHVLLSSCYNTVLELLGYNPVNWREILSSVNALFISDVNLREENGVLTLVVRGVNKDGVYFDVSLPLRGAAKHD